MQYASASLIPTYVFKNLRLWIYIHDVELRMCIDDSL